MAVSSPSSVLTISDTCVDPNWEEIGSGGFGNVYRTRHIDLGFDVAIKILHNKGSLNKEAGWMRLASSPDVLRILGVYSDSTRGQGLVMEFMEKGSLYSLLQSGPPPWSLSFRLAHQIALGMNFLHHLNPPLLHLDLKPQNVMLDKDLNAKLTDFGLSMISYSVVGVQREDTEQIGGTMSYMPPEAFDVTYKPNRASDVYSYGILLWSLVTGENPYHANVLASVLQLRIPLGDRPNLAKVNQGQTEGEMVDLMVRCWDQVPSKRPSFKDCLTVTDKLFKKHKLGIHDAVYQVHKQLDSISAGEYVASRVTGPDVSGSYLLPDPVHSKDQMVMSNHVKTGPFPTTDTVDGLNSNPTPKIEGAEFVGKYRQELIQRVTMVLPIAEDMRDMIHPELYAQIQAASTNPDKMRVMYNVLKSGKRVKSAFYSALKKNEPNLIEDLETEG